MVNKTITSGSDVELNFKMNSLEILCYPINIAINYLGSNFPITGGSCGGLFDEKISIKINY